MSNIEATKRLARELLDSRIVSVTEIVEARQRGTDLEVQLAEAKNDDKKAYVRATKAGGTPRRYGTPGKRAMGRRENLSRPASTTPTCSSQ